jgi:hypothetical protein
MTLSVFLIRFGVRQNRKNRHDHGSWPRTSRTWGVHPMSKDPNRYTPRPYGHAAPWNRRAAEATDAAPADPVAGPDFVSEPAAVSEAEPAAAGPEAVSVAASVPVRRLARRWPWAVVVDLLAGLSL